MSKRKNTPPTGTSTTGTGRRHKASTAFSQAGNDNRSFEYTISAAERSRALTPPVDNTLVETLHGHRVSDPFRPLEDLQAPETAAWVTRQNARFIDYIQPSQGFYDSTFDFLNGARPKGLAESMPSRIGPNLYSCWRAHPGKDRWSLFLKEVPDYDAPARLLLDPLAIDPAGKTDISGTYYAPGGKILAYTLSVAGSDENTVHFMDVATGDPLPIHYPATRSWRNGITWARDGESFTYIRPVDSLAKSFEVLRHVMGSDITSDEVIYSPATPETRVSFLKIKRDMITNDSDYEWIYESQMDSTTNRLLMRKSGSSDAFAEVFPYGNGTLFPIAQIDGKIYAITSQNAPRRKVVRFDPAHPQPENWETVIGEHPTDLLNSVWTWQGKLFANYSHDTADKVCFFDKNGAHLGDMPLPPMSTVSFGQMRLSDTTCLVSLSGFQEDRAIYQYDSITNTLSEHRPSRRPVNLKDCVVERLHATSKDGTKVPMTVIRHPDTKLDGTAATILYGYGGFNVALEPSFSSALARWVRAGGIYVQANLRGGGEYGQHWYDQGRRDNKQNVFDDFAACAEHLIAGKYTSSKRLAIDGSSNGGLLTLATGLQRPELFGAIVSQVPVTDMNRFHIGSYYGFGWKGDYGDPDVKADFNTAAKYSPYHNVKKGFAHPPILIDTDANDDRVLPWHSYKMAALLQAREARGSTTVMNVAVGGGHGGGGSLKLGFQSTAAVYAFLERTLGPIDQKAYKATLKPKVKIQASRSSGNNVERMPKTKTGGGRRR